MLLQLYDMLFNFGLDVFACVSIACAFDSDWGVVFVLGDVDVIVCCCSTLMWLRFVLC